MSTITLPNIRVFSDLTVKVRLKDGGVAIDWSTLSNLRAWIYSDAQSSFAGRCDVTVDGEDATLLVCRYAATRMQYLGVNRIVVSARYMGAAKTYDKPVLNFVRWTEDQAGEQITIEDPEVTVEIDVEDISSSILQEAVDAAFSAAVRADEAAAAAEHMVDIHQGPPGPAGKAPYVDATTGNWFVWDDQTEQYVDSGNPAQGPAGNGIASWSVVESQEDGGSNVVTVVFTNGESESFTVKNGNTGATPNLVMGIVTTGAPGSQAGAQITGTPANPILHLTIPQGEPGVAAVRYVQVDTLPSASSHTLDALYLVPTNTTDVYDVYYTTRDGQTYSWVKLCTTSAQLSDYATKAELDQLEAEVSDGITEYTYAYSKLTSQQPNISLGQDTQLYLPGDFVEIKANSNGATGVLLRRATSYNQPGVRYTASNTLVIRMTSAANNFSYQDASVNANSVQTIKILLVSVSADFKNWGFEYYLDGTKIGDQTITTSGNTQYFTFIGQIGYDSVADIYYVKIKSNGTETEYTKLAEIVGAVGVTDIYTSESFDGLVGLNERLSVQEAELAHLAEAVERAEGADMYFVFRKVSALYNCESDFYVYQRLKGNIYSKIAIAFYISIGDKPNGYWRVERTNLVSIDEYGEETLIQSQAIVAGENEFVLQWLAGSGYNYDGGYTGGFHYGETIKNVAGAWVEFVADGNVIDTSADIPLTPCKTFYYREYSPIYQHNDGTIAAWHFKETKFNDGGYEVVNDVKFIQALDYFAYPGIVCVSRYLSEYAMPENVATITDMGDGEPTQTEQFKSNGHRIHYEGNGYATDVFSEFRAGADDSLCSRVVYNSTAYNKYYRRNPDTPGSTDNRLVAFTKVAIKKM